MTSRPERWTTAAAMIPAGVLLALPLLLGCEGEAGPAGRGTVTDSAGVRIVEWPDPPPPPTRSLALDPGWMAGMQAEFGDLADLALLGEGRLAVLDAMNGRLVVLGPDGGVQAAMGAVGEGPGEFSAQGLSRVVATDTSLLVPDLQLQRITEFDPHGGVLAIHPFGAGLPGGEPTYAVDWRRHPSGGLAFRILEPSRDLLVRWHGEGLDTLRIVEMPPQGPNQLLAPTVLWDVDPDGRLLIGRSDHPELEAWRVGDVAPEWMGRRLHRPEEVTPEDERHLEALLFQSAEARGGEVLSSEDRQRILASVEMPTYRPRFARVLAGDAGAGDEARIWVQRAREIAEMGLDAMRVGDAAGFGGVEWEVLGPRGRLIEVVRFPPEFSPLRFLEGCVYGIVRDQWEVERPGRVCPEIMD